jgi:antitoxin component of MazEF toxin-antitoxin module
MSVGMKRVSLSGAALVAAFAVSAQASPAKPPAAPPAAAAPAPSQPIGGALVGEVTQWKGVVMAVNQDSRQVVLKGPQGTLHPFTIPADVQNFYMVKKGDTVTVDYVEAIAIYVREKSDPPVTTAEAATRTVAPKGLPSVLNVVTKEVEAKITALDAAKRSMTLKGPMGNSYTMTVDPSVTQYSSLKVGDTVVVRYTEATAVKVTR